MVVINFWPSGVVVMPIVFSGVVIFISEVDLKISKVVVPELEVYIDDVSLDDKRVIGKGVELSNCFSVRVGRKLDVDEGMVNEVLPKL